MNEKKTSTLRKKEGKKLARGSLTSKSIVEKALKIVDEEGLKALTFRKLANEFGCAHTAIFPYFKNRNELLREVHNAAYTKFNIPNNIEGPWDKRAWILCNAIYNAIVSHPFMFELSRLFPRVSHESKAFHSIATDAGYSDKDAVYICLLLMEFTVGFAFNALIMVEDEAPRAEFFSQSRSNEEIEFFLKFNEIDRTQVFEKGLESLIDGIKRGITFT